MLEIGRNLKAYVSFCFVLICAVSFILHVNFNRSMYRFHDDSKKYLTIVKLSSFLYGYELYWYLFGIVDFNVNRHVFSFLYESIITFELCLLLILWRLSKANSDLMPSKLDINRKPCPLLCVCKSYIWFVLYSRYNMFYLTRNKSMDEKYNKRKKTIDLKS